MHSGFEKEALHESVCLCYIQCVVHVFVSNKLFNFIAYALAHAMFA